MDNMKLLALIASPRKNGNCRQFVQRLHERMEGKWDLQVVNLSEQNIKPCRACYKCLFDAMKCPLEDDHKFVLNSLVSADAYVVASPVYFLGANYSLKNFLDRGLSFYGEARSLWGKPAVGVAIAGLRGLEGYAKLAVESFIKLSFGDLRCSDVLYGALPGEIFDGPEGEEVAQKFARALVLGYKETEKGQSSVPSCKVCGGDTFRFLPGGGVRCMLCSCPGTIDLSAHHLMINTNPEEHSIFHNWESVVSHLGFLRRMKLNFVANSKRNI